MSTHCCRKSQIKNLIRPLTIVGILTTMAAVGVAFEYAPFRRPSQGNRTTAPTAPAKQAAEGAQPTAAAPVKKSDDAASTKNVAAAPAASDFAKELPVTYRVRQIVRIDEIPAGAKQFQAWVSIPDDEVNQRVLDFDVVAAPGKWTIVHDAEHRGRFVMVDVKNPSSPSLDVEVEFIVTRKPVLTPVDPAKAGPLTEGMRKALAADLAADAPHMEVTDKILEIADEVCGQETNLATQASMLMDYVAKVADHYSYSKDPNMPKCGIGDAKNCLAQGGGCCTDLHSLFIALARARSIPARLQMGYRLQEKNLGKMVDPGYRCWVEYFVPNFGWVSADIVEADAPNGLGPKRWTVGLTARRVWLNQGREFQLANNLAVERVNHMSIAYAEIDGVPARLLPEGELKPQITRQVMFTELSPSPVDPVAAATP